MKTLEEYKKEFSKLGDRSQKTYNGGYSEDEEREIFHHGIRTGLRVSEAFIEKMYRDLAGKNNYIKGYIDSFDNFYKLHLKEKKENKKSGYCPKCLGMDDESSDCEYCDGTGQEH